MLEWMLRQGRSFHRITLSEPFTQTLFPQRATRNRATRPFGVSLSFVIDAGRVLLCCDRLAPAGTSGRSFVCCAVQPVRSTSVQGGSDLNVARH